MRTKLLRSLVPPPSPTGTGRRTPMRLLACALAACGLAVMISPSLEAQTHGGREFYDENYSTNAAEAAVCKTNLLRIHAALESYRQGHRGNWPTHLSGLVPAYLNRPDILKCPFVTQTTRWIDWRRTLRKETFRDPGDVSYSYEFIEEPLDELLEAGLTNATVRECKRRQAALLASLGLNSNNVPVVRCLCHRPVLNLTPDGRVYESDIEWEDKFSNVAEHVELMPHRLFANEISHVQEKLDIRRPANPIPPRPAGLPPRLIDLTAYYNVALDETWHTGHPNNDLAQLLKDPSPLSPSEFDLRGLIQLRDSRRLLAFPPAVRNIPVERKARALVFLHATAHPVPNNTQIATYVVHFNDGSTREIPVRYGMDLCDWWHDPNSKSPDHCVIAWQGSNAAARHEERIIRLFQTRWTNPRPDVLLHHLDFVSTVTDSAPFLVAVTAED